MLDEAKETAIDNIIYTGRIERRPILTTENTKVECARRRNGRNGAWRTGAGMRPVK